jgi:hypothetical protein
MARGSVRGARGATGAAGGARCPDRDTPRPPATHSRIQASRLPYRRAPPRTPRSPSAQGQPGYSGARRAWGWPSPRWRDRAGWWARRTSRGPSRRWRGRAGYSGAGRRGVGRGAAERQLARQPSGTARPAQYPSVQRPTGRTGAGGGARPRSPGQARPAGTSAGGEDRRGEGQAAATGAAGAPSGPNADPAGHSRRGHPFPSGFAAAATHRGARGGGGELRLVPDPCVGTRPKEGRAAQPRSRPPDRAHRQARCNRRRAGAPADRSAGGVQALRGQPRAAGRGNDEPTGGGRSTRAGPARARQGRRIQIRNDAAGGRRRALLEGRPRIPGPTGRRPAGTPAGQARGLTGSAASARAATRRRSTAGACQARRRQSWGDQRPGASGKGR